MQPADKQTFNPSAELHSSHPKFKGEGLTYDDVLLVPAKSDVMPREEIGRASCRERV